MTQRIFTTFILVFKFFRQKMVATTHAANSSDFRLGCKYPQSVWCKVTTSMQTHHQTVLQIQGKRGEKEGLKLYKGRFQVSFQICELLSGQFYTKGITYQFICKLSNCFFQLKQPHFPTASGFLFCFVFFNFFICIFLLFYN